MIKLIFGLLISTAFAALNNVEKANFEQVNLLENPGFELGTAKWSVSSSVDDPMVISSSAPGAGLRNITFDASASGRKLISNAVAIPAGLYGQSGVARCNIKTPSGTATHTIGAFDGSNPVGTATTVTSATNYSRAAQTFTFPTSGNIQLQIIGQANEPLIHVDECYLGLGTLSGTAASNAGFYGAISYAGTTNCDWAQAPSSSYGGYGADTDCPAASVVGNASAPGTKIPAVVFSTMPAGTYLFVAEANLHARSSSVSCKFRFHDGTNGFGFGQIFRDGAGGQGANVIGYITYASTQTNKTFNIQAAGNGAGTCAISNEGSQDAFKIEAYYFPTL